MENYIFITGPAFWVILGFLVLLFLGFIYIGNSYIKSRQEIYKKDRQLKKLRSEYNLLIGEYHRATFKVPDIGNTEETGDTK